MKPMVYGYAKNIQPVNVETQSYIYNIHDYSIDEIYAITFHDYQRMEYMEVEYNDNMPGMTLEEFNAYVDSLVKEVE